MPNRPLIFMVGVTVSQTGVLTASRAVLVTAAEEHETDAPVPAPERHAPKPTLAKALPANVYRLPARRTA